MRTPKSHEQRVGDALQRWYDLPAEVQGELAVPARHFRVDFVTRVDEPSVAWGVLRPDVAHRDQTGIHRVLLGLPGELIILETEQLPKVQGTALIRLLTIPRTRAMSDEFLDALEADCSFPEALRKQVVRDIMEEKVQTREEEHESAFDRAVRMGMEKGLARGERRGLAKGERRGERRGLEKGRRALLDLARDSRRVSDDELRTLENIEDIDALKMRVAELLLRD